MQRPEIGFVMAAAAVTILFTADRALAVEDGLSPYLKGAAGFMSGLVPPHEGFYLTDNYFHFHGSVDANVRGGVAEFGVGTTLDADLLTGIYVTNAKFLGATYALGATVDYIWAGLHASLNKPGGPDVHLSENGVGDSLLTPVILGWNNGDMHYNFNFSVYAPTGSYDKTRLSVGKNIWAFMPQLAATWYDPKSGLDVSGALTYVTMTNNDATDYQSGDLLHFDWGIGLHFGAKQQWEAGVNGNLVEQISGDSGTGAILGPLEAESAGIGPAISTNTEMGNIPMSFTAKWESDFSAHKTFGGNIVSVSATAVF